ncbi:hypothetical protein FDP22_19680 (plasmid) [Paroceanicella profunda]|uniref:Ca-activated chloride channel family protein n=1 Tax=Paroceanicella profunda TaxID=2579971 RepID=A0A5B8G3W3_9RHOB|nr:hypothetical protein [Paroceanicella profunda]QDL94089.1 hypothetical protein FDP22_19680 [Paroceanicella profunda]
MRRGALLAAGLALALAIAAGPQAWARLAWRAGAPALALPLLEGDAPRGAALYALGRYAQADAAFARVGRSATYNRALTLAMTGRPELSVAYFDAYLFSNRFDSDARRSRDFVATLVEPVVGEAMGHGRIRALLAGAGVAAEAFDPDAPERELLSSENDPTRANAKRPVDGDRMVAASDAWLDTLADAPGVYLRSRLAAEMERRRATGTALAEEGVRW